MSDASHKFCPHCGFDLVVDTPILLNDYSMIGAGRPLMYKGRKVTLTPAEALICWSLMKAYPEPVTRMTLAERIGSQDGKDPDRLIMVLVWRIRNKLKVDRLPIPIETIPDMHSYIWDPRA